MNKQTVGNVGLYYTCYRLSQFGWNAMPTARNAKGIDILAYSEDASRIKTVQVKTLSSRSNISLDSTDNLIFDVLVICRLDDPANPKCFLLTRDRIKELRVPYGTGKKAKHWLRFQKYESQEFLEKWEEKIGFGYLTPPSPPLPKTPRRGRGRGR